jgi:hypothetical protein
MALRLAKGKFQRLVVPAVGMGCFFGSGAGDGLREARSDD